MTGLPIGALFWVAVACCVVAQIAITAAALRQPHPADAECEVPMPERATEVAWSLIPAVMLALVLLLTWNAIRLVDAGRAVPAAEITDIRTS